MTNTKNITVPLGNNGASEQVRSSGKNFKEFLKSKGIDVDSPKVKAQVEHRKNMSNDDFAKENSQIGAKWEKELQKQKKQDFVKYSLIDEDMAKGFRFSRWKTVNTDGGRVIPAIKLLNQAKAVVERINDGEIFNVYMQGRPGTGKTSLALAITNEVALNGKTAMVVSTNNLYGMYDERYNDERVRGRIRYTIELMQDVDVLVLDDLGTEAGGKLKPVRRDMVADLVQVSKARYNGTTNMPKKLTITTTNNTRDELATLYNEKFVSRLLPNLEDYKFDFNELPDKRNQ